MPRRPVGPVWTVNHVRLTVVPDARAPGRWLCKVVRRDTGDRTQTQYATEREAIAAAEALQRTLTAPGGGVRPASERTVDELIEQYIRTRSTLNTTRRRSTFKAQATFFRYIRGGFATRQAGMITPQEVTDWLGTLLAPPHGRGHLAPITVMNTLRALRHVLGPLGAENPATGLAMKAERIRPQEPWTPPELQRILDAAREGWGLTRPQYVLGLWLWMQSGLRAGEVLALRDGDLDVTAGTVRVAETYSDRRLGPLKTPRSRPPFIVLPTLSPGGEWRPGSTAESWRVVGWYEHLRARRQVPRGFLCGQTPDTPWHHATMFRWYRQVLAQAGVAYREPEIFRHTMAATLLARGAPTTFVRDQGAWESLAIVERVYAKYLPAAFTAEPRPVEVENPCGPAPRDGVFGSDPRPARPVDLLRQQLTTMGRKSVKTQR